MISTVGAKPACLVNASVTYVGDDQIYAFGGFDQYTDEGEQTSVEQNVARVNPEGEHDSESTCYTQGNTSLSSERFKVAED